jgi:hypothetical protein
MAPRESLSGGTAWVDPMVGLACRIERGADGSLRGYVAVPESHPLFGHDRVVASRHLEVRSGITWSGPLYGERWLVGFECRHSPNDTHGGGVDAELAMAKREVERLAVQVAGTRGLTRAEVDAPGSGLRPEVTPPAAARDTPMRGSAGFHQQWAPAVRTEVAATTAPTAAPPTYRLVETVHPATRNPAWVVNHGKGLDTAKFDALREAAAMFHGQYVRHANPRGFLFSSRKAAEAFVAACGIELEVARIGGPCAEDSSESLIPTQPDTQMARVEAAPAVTATTRRRAERCASAAPTARPPLPLPDLVNEVEIAIATFFEAAVAFWRAHHNAFGSGRDYLALLSPFWEAVVLMDREGRSPERHQAREASREATLAELSEFEAEALSPYLERISPVWPDPLADYADAVFSGDWDAPKDAVTLALERELRRLAYPAAERARFCQAITRVREAWGPYASLVLYGSSSAKAEHRPYRVDDGLMREFVDFAAEGLSSDTAKARVALDEAEDALDEETEAKVVALSTLSEQPSVAEYASRVLTAISRMIGEAEQTSPALATELRQLVPVLRWWLLSQPELPFSTARW